MTSRADPRAGPAAGTALLGGYCAVYLILVVIIFARVIGGSAPGGQEFTLTTFTVPDGVGFGTIALAAVYGFLSFAGLRGGSLAGRGDGQSAARHTSCHRGGGAGNGRLLRNRHAGANLRIRRQRGGCKQIRQLVFSSGRSI